MRLRPWAEDLCHLWTPPLLRLGRSSGRRGVGPLSRPDPGDRREQLRAELDAFFAMNYGLTREELVYVLDPAKAKGEDYPSETFRVLQKNEIARFGEYRTERLVLAAFDQADRLVSCSERS